MKTDGRVRVSSLDWITIALVVIGALNWGLVGVGQLIGANWNVVNLLFGVFPSLEAAIYVVVGLAGLYELNFAYQLYVARRSRPQQRGTPED